MPPVPQTPTLHLCILPGDGWLRVEGCPTRGDFLPYVQVVSVHGVSQTDWLCRCKRVDLDFTVLGGVSMVSLSDQSTTTVLCQTVHVMVLHG